MRPPILPRLTLPLASIVALTLATLIARAANPDALWTIVHTSCTSTATPAPCEQLGPDDAVLKDRVGRTQFLLIPTARITGIESPAILDPAAPNYFAHAWAARSYVEARAGHPLPRDAIALAINPPGARSQEQLHIHIDCLRPDVRDAIRDALQNAPAPANWTTLPTPLAGQHYAALRLPGPALDANPFRLLADGLPGPMAAYTLVLAGTPDGFILLAGRIGADGPAHGEDLQDHNCAIAQQPAP